LGRPVVDGRRAARSASGSIAKLFVVSPCSRAKVRAEAGFQAPRPLPVESGPCMSLGAARLEGPPRPPQEDVGSFAPRSAAQGPGSAFKPWPGRERLIWRSGGAGETPPVPEHRVPNKLVWRGGTTQGPVLGPVRPLRESARCARPARAGRGGVRRRRRRFLSWKVNPRRRVSASLYTGALGRGRGGGRHGRCRTRRLPASPPSDANREGSSRDG